MQFFKKVTFSTQQDTIAELKEALNEYGVVHLSNYNLDLSLHEFYQNLSDEIGKAFSTDEDLITGKSLENRWIDISYDPNIQDRYRTSNTRQPLHTDDSYVELYDEKAVQFFYCESRAALGGATTFLDLSILIKTMEIDKKDDLLARLFSTEVNFEKAGRKKVRKILDKDDTGLLVNWNYYCIDKNNTPEALQLVEEFHAFLETRIINSGLVLPIQLEKGDAVFFHDDRLLHGRNAYFATHKGERCLIKGKIILDNEKVTS
jgi:alpha-ketoglutarate-dependent taurine dioxygenase